MLSRHFGLIYNTRHCRDINAMARRARSGRAIIS
nr:MAG TPA: hypothetical protein [Caudoviricetes sp.]